MRDTCICGACAVLLAIGASNALANPVYRWVDASGVVNYSTERPPAGAQAPSVRVVDLTEPVVSHESPQDRALRLAREQSEAAQLALARQQRLEQELLEQRIATERARAALLAAQAAATNSPQYQDCNGNDGYIDGYCSSLVLVGVRPLHRYAPPGRAWHPPAGGPAPRSVGTHRLS